MEDELARCGTCLESSGSCGSSLRFKYVVFLRVIGVIGNMSASKSEVQGSNP